MALKLPAKTKFFAGKICLNKPELILLIVFQSPPTWLIGKAQQLFYMRTHKMSFLRVSRLKSVGPAVPSVVFLDSGTPLNKDLP